MYGTFAFPAHKKCAYSRKSGRFFRCKGAVLHRAGRMTVRDNKRADFLILRVISTLLIYIKHRTSKQFASSVPIAQTNFLTRFFFPSHL